MKMELIQPFINSADAVLAEMLQSSTRIDDVAMQPEAYRRHGVAAEVVVEGEIEGRVIFDLDGETASRVAAQLTGAEVAGDAMVGETICELANLVIGNAVTALNDQGFRFKINPPRLHTSERGPAISEDTEALLLCFDTSAGNVYVNIAMRYHHRRRQERQAAVV